ncbi:MAG: hypothetical protein ABIC95_04245 [archaeon]
MDRRIVDEVLSDLTPPGLDKTEAFTELKGYASVPFSEKRFTPLTPTDRSLISVDGGNQEILGNSTMSFSFLRVCGVIVAPGKKRRIEKKEQYLLVRTRIKDGRPLFEARILREGEEDDIITIDPMEESLRRGMYKATPQDAVGLIRRVSELRLAEVLVKEAEQGCLVVIDGTLQCFFAAEQDALISLLATAKSRKVDVCALAKSSQFSTARGDSISAALLANEPIPIWIYHPLLETDLVNHPAEIAFAKLHPRARKAFRFEVPKGDDPVAAAYGLVGDSTDPVFFGYPYGLVMADRFGRVQNEEIDYLKTRLFSLAKDRQDLIDMILADTDSHRILDTTR